MMRLAWGAARLASAAVSRRTQPSLARPIAPRTTTAAGQGTAPWTAVRLASSAAAALPTSAEVVVIGGGIIGTSTAYHLAELGHEVVQLEQSSLTAGTTWHAAGLMVTFGSLSETSTEFRKYSKALYQRLEAETGLSTGFKPCGFIELATSRDRLEEFRRVAAFNRKCGVDVQEIGPADVQRLFPLCETSDVLAGFYVEDDGRVNPVDATMSLARGARMKGARLFEHVRVARVTTSDPAATPAATTARSTHTPVPHVTGVELEDGRTIQCSHVVNCGGMWARQLAARSGVTVPNQAAEHYYLVTDAMPEVSQDWPVVEDPSSFTYIRPEGAGLMVGLFEGTGAAWNVDAVPGDFSFGDIPPDWERLAPYLEVAMGRVPRTLEAGVKTFFCGPESFTPDLGPCIGEAPEVRNYFVAAGLNSIGILTGGGVGRLVARWVHAGEPPADTDVTGVRPDRFRRYQATAAFRRARVEESLGLVYRPHYPYIAPATARHVKRSPLHEHFRRLGAHFRDVSGWESPELFGQPPDGPPGGMAGWTDFAWWPQWEAEHRACRERAVLMDMGFMSKFRVAGPGAARGLNLLSTANVVGDAPGQIRYTQWLNDDGRLEADLTVARIGPDEFLVIATDTAHRRVESLLRRAFAAGDRVHISDVTSGLAQLNLQGPRSRELLAAVTPDAVDAAALPFGHVRELEIGCAPVRCARITYVGELGYELYVPSEYLGHVYETLVAAGEGVGLAHAGLKALSSLRMEKAYRDFGHDLDNTDHLLEAGLGFTCDFDKPGGFRGRDAVLAYRAERPTPHKRLVQVLCQEPSARMFHGEVLYRDGVVVGDIRAASYGHTLGGAVGLAMLEADQPVTQRYCGQGGAGGPRFEVEVAGARVPATVSLRPLYDPGNKRVRA